MEKYRSRHHVLRYAYVRPLHGTWYQVLPNHLPAQFMQYTVFLYFAVVPGTMVLLLIYLYVVGPSYETPEHINIYLTIVLIIHVLMIHFLRISFFTQSR